MGLPKKRLSSSRRDKRRTHDALTAPHLSKCSHCGKPTMSHRMCKECGYYKGKAYLTKKAA